MAGRSALSKLDAAPSGMVITDKDRSFWSFQIPKRSQPAVAAGTDWPKQPIDFFIASALSTGDTIASTIRSDVLVSMGEVDEIYGWFGLKPEIKFGTKPAKALGDPALWDKAEGPLPRADVSYPELAVAAAFVCTEGRCSAPSRTPIRSSGPTR